MGVKIVVPGVWIIVSMLGMLISLFWTIVVAIVSTKKGTDRLETRIENQDISPARELKDELIEHGIVEDVDAFNALINSSNTEYSEVQKIERIEDSNNQIRFHFADTTEQTHIRNFSKMLDEKKERLVKQRQLTYVQYSLEFVALGFLLQFTSMIARHMVIIT